MGVVITKPVAVKVVRKEGLIYHGTDSDFSSDVVAPVCGFLTVLFIVVYKREYIFGHSCYTVVLQNVGTPCPWEIT